VLGAEPGHGFAQMMKGLEIGRIQVAARAVGVAQAAFDDALRYAQQRESFGVPIWKHQAIGNYLADMATKLTAARQLVQYAAARATRYFRDAPLMIVGEGTNEIQRNVIAAQLISRGGLDR
jgi:alkylation response protein AidB-like acyl-CoA dehydrogenase